MGELQVPLRKLFVKLLEGIFHGDHFYLLWKCVFECHALAPYDFGGGNS